MDARTMADLLVGALTVMGGIGAALITSRFTRRSQSESNKISEANGIVERYDQLTAALASEGTRKDARVTFLERQVSLWRRASQRWRSQIYQLGGKPEDAPPDLEL